MQSFDILKKIHTSNSFRAEAIKGRYDVQNSIIEERFVGQLPSYNDDWQIGLIVGASGSGKSTIANQVFGNYMLASSLSYSGASVVDDMPQSASVDDISNAFSSVGFSSIPSWLKPYSVLSNGEKMRVDLARCLLSKEPVICFDEFTSVVDRNVAKIGSYAVQKAIRRTDKKFIAVSCHCDIEDWLMPDWVFNTNEMSIRFCEKKKEKPQQRLEIFVVEKQQKAYYWSMFAKHHYINSNHSNSAQAFIAVLDGEVCGFCSVVHQPTNYGELIKRVHRLVVLPDYQGLSIGKILLEGVGRHYIAAGFGFSITTSSPSLVFSLKKSPDWVCTYFGRNTPHDGFKSVGSSLRVTSGWKLIPKNK